MSRRGGSKPRDDAADEAAGDMVEAAVDDAVDRAVDRAMGAAVDEAAGGAEGGVAGGHDDVHYTIDELAALSGVPSRTIRFYQSKGTLPSPERRGRVALYRAEHVERLRMIAGLQDRGLRLDAIRDALEQIEKGGSSLHAWLGIGDELQAPWSDEQPIVISEADLVQRLDTQRPGILTALERAELIQRQGNSRPATYVVPSPGLLDIAITLDRAGVDPATAAEAAAIMRRRIGHMTDELVGHFSEHAGHGFGSSGDADEIVRAIEGTRAEGLHAVQLIFAQEMERALRQFVEAGGTIPTSRRNRSSEPKVRRAERKADRRASS